MKWLGKDLYIHTCSSTIAKRIYSSRCFLSFGALCSGDAKLVGFTVLCYQAMRYMCESMIIRAAPEHEVGGSAMKVVKNAKLAPSDENVSGHACKERLLNKRSRFA